MDILGMYASTQPDHVALVDDPPGGSARRITYAELNDVANRVASALGALGVGPGDKITTAGYNAPEHHVVAGAIGKLAATSVPMNYRLKPPEIAYQLDNSDTVAVFVGPDMVEAVDEARPAAPRLRHAIAWGTEDVPDGWLRMADLVAEGSSEPPALPEGATSGLMLYTAGTTGQPKGAYRAGGTPGGASSLDVFKLGPQMTHIVAGPLYHSAPYAFANLNVLLGGTNVLMRRYDPEEALRLISDHGVQWTFMAPTLLARIVNLPDDAKRRYDLSSMSTIIVAAAPCPFELKRRVMDLFGPVLYEFYGASETGMNTLITPDEHARKPGSCGRVVDGQHVKTVDEEGNPTPPGVPGEIYVRSDGVIDEYYKNPDATADAWRDGYFSVGDVGYFDEDGYLYICDRKRDMIISGGANIYCAEVENVIHAHPKVWDVAVIGVPNDEWGEQVHAIVQPKAGEEPTADEIIRWVGEHLADYKRPRSVEFRPDFPRDEAGKIRKRELREPFWAGRTTRV